MVSNEEITCCSHPKSNHKTFRASQSGPAEAICNDCPDHVAEHAYWIDEEAARELYASSF